MKILIDTHILLYALDNKNALTADQISTLNSDTNKVYVSQFSLMEISIKLKIGKLFIRDITINELIEHILNDGIHLLPMLNEHISSYLDIPLFENHRDPFDRFIIATAKAEGMTIMTNDSKFTQYQHIVQLWK